MNTLPRIIFSCKGYCKAEIMSTQDGECHFQMRTHELYKWQRLDADSYIGHNIENGRTLLCDYNL